MFKSVVVGIDAHPRYQPHFTAPPSIPQNEVDAHMTAILQQSHDLHAKDQEIAASMVAEERNAIGNNVCWQCTHRKDMRVWWKRLLFAANESSYECTSTQRTKVADPVSGQVRFIERVRGTLGGLLVLVDRPHRRCVEMNPDGHCPSFNIHLIE